MNIPKVEKSETRTRSHPRLFLWLVVSLKVVCLRPEKLAGRALGRSPREGERVPLRTAQCQQREDR